MNRNLPDLPADWLLRAAVEFFKQEGPEGSKRPAAILTQAERIERARKRAKRMRAALKWAGRAALVFCVWMLYVTLATLIFKEASSGISFAFAATVLTVFLYSRITRRGAVK